MKSQIQNKGQMAEDFAVSHLESLGFEILRRRWRPAEIRRHQAGEVDILARGPKSALALPCQRPCEASYWIFEVKSLRWNGSPIYNFLTAAQWKRLSRSRSLLLREIRKNQPRAELLMALVLVDVFKQRVEFLFNPW